MPKLPISEIASSQNPRYKLWRKYARKPDEPACPWIPIEGRRQIHDVAQQRSIELLLISSSFREVPSGISSVAREIVYLPEQLLSPLCQVRQNQGILAFVEKPSWSVDDLGSFILYLDRLQDPGNLGTLIRSAAATGLFSIACSPGTVSCFNDKVVRATVGELFRVPVVHGVRIETLRKLGHQIWAAAPGKGVSLFEAGLEPPLAFIVSNEGQGIDPVLQESDLRFLSIPMQPEVDSLNAAVSGSLLMYEVYRKTLRP